MSLNAGSSLPRRMASVVANLLEDGPPVCELLDSPNFYYFPRRIHAARDMMRIQGLSMGMHGVFQAPRWPLRPGQVDV